ncbi:MAG: hypothetical protein SPI65_00150 [Peptoniphilus sp.]|nr:hypothetical protein [Peptoniphilus sp.]MDD7362835.1 hypothetical protein [Bacillota bacterium]MDY6043973.1 hypothetical protein [Peptoniphilus sp.]
MKRNDPSSVDSYSEEQLIKDLKNLHAPTRVDKQEVSKRMKQKKKQSFKKPAIASVAALLILTLPFTSFGEGIYDTIRQVVTPSKSIVVNEEKSNVDTNTLAFPEELKGKLFDKNGNEMKSVKQLEKMEAVYNADGQEIDSISYDENGGVHLQLKKDRGEDDYAVHAPVEKLASRLTFTPLVLSEPYAYQCSYLFTDEPTTDTAAFLYTTEDGREIYIDERVATRENAYETGSDEKIEEINRDGVKLIVQGSSLYFERDDLLVSLNAKGADKDELLAMYDHLAPLQQ